MIEAEMQTEMNQHRNQDRYNWRTMIIHSKSIVENSSWNIETDIVLQSNMEIDIQMRFR